MFYFREEEITVNFKVWQEKHTDIKDKVKEIDPSFLTDTLYISII